MRSTRRGSRWAQLDAHIVYAVCDRFMKHESAMQIAAYVNEKFGEPLARTQVYQVLAEGRARGYFHLTPPREELLELRMADRFAREHAAVAAPKARGGETRGGEARGGEARERTIRVVSRAGEASLGDVAMITAREAFDVVFALHDEQRRTVPRSNGVTSVHIGFGAGSTTKLVARFLAERLRSEVSPPAVVLHALSSGFSVDEPASAPVAFFNFFHGIPNVSYKGLFAPAYVRPEDWERTIDFVGVKESFAAKRDLQVVITSLASRWDDHGELNRFMDVNAGLGRKLRQVLDKQEKRVGDVLYRPYNARQPITRPAGIRPVTLFEIDELVAFARDPRKAVILVAGPCGEPGCRRSRSDALLPLLTQPALRVWSHLVVDDLTARQCLEA